MTLFTKACLILAACSLPALGAPITWGTPAVVSDPSDVSTTGTLIEALNAGGTTSGVNVTVNTVPFVGTSTLLDLDSDTNVLGTTTGNTAYDNLLKSIDFGGGSNLVSLSVGNAQLNSGMQYEIQVWFNDARYSTPGRTTPVGDGLGNKANLTSNPGTHVTGVFVADAVSQTLTLESPGFGNAHLTAYQIRELPSGPLPDPEVPSNLVAIAGDEEVSLDWNDNNQFGFSNFIVRRSTTEDGPYTDIPGATPTDSSYLDTGLTNDVTYYYVVAAKNTDDVTSADSLEADATPEEFVPDPPLTPTGLSILEGNNRNTLNWDDNNQEGFLEFQVMRGTDMGGPYTEIGTTSNSVYVDNTAANGMIYYYVIIAVNIDNDESPPSDEVSGTPSMSAEPPNFLFIITDDQDTYSINAYRNTEAVELTSGGQPYPVDTPNIDRLATEGMLFHQARYMGSWTGAVCTGSRTCIMTGMNTWDSLTYRDGVDDPVNTFPGVFNLGARSGTADIPHATYRTCKNGNSYATANSEFSVQNDVTKRGNTDGSGSEWHGEWAIDYIEDWETNHRPNGKPFLMYLGFSHPHDTRNARDASNLPDLASRYGSFNTSDPASITLINPASPPAPINLLECTPATFPAHPFDNGDLYVRDEDRADGIDRYRTEEVVRNESGRNFACVDWIDQQLGLVFDKLEDPNGDGDNSDSIIDNTYIVFTSDHGIAIGRHGLQGKQNLYEHTWKVPFIVRGPGIQAGSESDALVYLHDTFPTFCDLAGIDHPATLDQNDGMSFRDVLEGTSQTHRPSVYGTYSGGSKPGMRSVTDGRFKLIKYDVDGDATQVTQLFDLQTNPFELLPEHGVDNIATLPAYASIRQRLEEDLTAHRIENIDPYEFLGDRTVLRFEEGPADGEATAALLDRMPFENDGAAFSYTGGTLPVYSSDVPNPTDFVFGEDNLLSLDLEADLKQYVRIEDDPALNFGATPFTIEAWVKLESLPTGNNVESSRPVAMKKVIGSNDSGFDYMFLAAAGSYGDALTFDRLALRVGNTTLTSSLSIQDNQWHHISVALDPVSDTLRFTLDDQVDTQTSITAVGTTNSGPLIIGAHFDSSSAVDRSFDGKIDEFSITDGFLELSEIQPLEAVAEVEEFEITSFQIDPGGSTFSLTFESDETRLYNIECSTSLGDWIVVDSFIVGESGSTETTVADLELDSNNPKAFYRVTTAN
ncbi:sulfatase-like hydrolase/transferase [Haloferula sp.]|uniref:sulfatase-like hydrolase/transferase n=1 Tax=Haloferula sp. TaxID=2497595 RepID=UPI00329A9E3C